MLPPGLWGMSPELLPLFPAEPFGPALVLAAPLLVVKISLEVAASGGNTRTTPEAAELAADAELNGTGDALA